MAREMLLGLCPIGKFVFSHEDAVRQKKTIQGKLEELGITYCDLDQVLPDGMVRDQKHVGPVVAYCADRLPLALPVPVELRVRRRSSAEAGKGVVKSTSNRGGISCVLRIASHTGRVPFTARISRIRSTGPGDAVSLK